MRKVFFFFLLITAYQLADAQKVDSIFFNLYTDSLKKGFYNYISVDGKFTDGHWEPLDTTFILLTCNTGYFKGNDLFIDSSYKKDSVVVKATLKNNPRIWKQTTIYIRKRGFDEPLETTDELRSGMDKKRKRSRNRFA